MKLNEKIIYCRKKCGISQEALGDMIGVSRQAVSKWETGDALPEVTKLKALADVFGVTVDWLLDETDGTENHENPTSDGSQAEYFTVHESGNESKETASTLGIHSTGSGLADRFALFVKRYVWLGGILLILYGVYRAVFGVIALTSSLGTIGVFGATAGIPISLSCLFQVAIGGLFIAAGIYVIKKFKPKKVKSE